MGSDTTMSDEQLEPLSELEERFALEYVTCLNATQAYLRIKPGVKYTTARTEAARLLAKPGVKAYLAELGKEIKTDKVMTATEVLEQLSAIGRADQRDIWESVPGGGVRLRPLEELPPEVAAAVEEIAFEPTQYGVKRKVKLASKLTALDKLGQYHKLFKSDEQQGPLGWVFPVPPDMSLDDWMKRFSPSAAGVLSSAPKRSTNRTDIDGENDGDS
jgi:phage terminase small subunit